MTSWRISIYKTITWRVIAIVATFVISYLLTGSIALATTLSLVDFVVKTLLYLFHERLWARIIMGFGVKNESE